MNECKPLPVPRGSKAEEPPHVDPVVEYASSSGGGGSARLQPAADITPPVTALVPSSAPGAMGY